MKRRWLLMGAALLAAPTGAAQDGFTIVVARSNPASSLKRQEAARLFLKRTTRWADGSDVTPVDQSARSAVRLAFTRSVLRAEGMSAQSAVESYWQTLSRPCRTGRSSR
jgi:ABC-type phosphate transport system substrate-binding protein